MTTWPIANYWNVATRTESEQKAWGEEFLASTKQLPGASSSSTLTIVSDQITPTTGYHNVETQGGTATDNVAQILQTNLPDGSILYLSIATAGHTVVFKHAAGGTGQLALMGGVDFSMTATTMLLMLRRNGTGWEERGRFYGTAGADHRAFYGIPGFGQNRFTGRQEWCGGANLTAATTLPLGTDGNFFGVYGSSTITAIAPAPVGTVITLFFQGAPLLVHTANLLELPGGANLTVEPLSVLDFVSAGTGKWLLKSGGMGGTNGVRVLHRQGGAGVNGAQAAQVLVNPIVPAGNLGTLRRARLVAQGSIIWRDWGGSASSDFCSIGLYYGGVQFASLTIPDPLVAGGTIEPMIVEAFLSASSSTTSQIGHIRVTLADANGPGRVLQHANYIAANSTIDQPFGLLAFCSAVVIPSSPTSAISFNLDHAVLELV